MESSESIVAVTGAGGFLGHSLSRRLVADKVPVRALVRYRSEMPGEYQVDIANSIIDPQALTGSIRTVIHCAWDHKSRSLEEARRINLEGTQWLAERCREAGIKQFIFISSLAAHADAESVYARTKWETEHKLLSATQPNEITSIIAPGMIIGKGGEFARARTFVKTHGTIPVYYGNSDRRMQTVFIDDLCTAIITVLNNKIAGRIAVAEPEGVTLTDFYQGLSLLEQKKPLIYSFNGDKAMLTSRAMQAIRLKPRITAEELLAVKNLQHVDVSDSQRQLRTTMGDFWSSLEKLAIAEGLTEVAAQIRAAAK